MKFTMALPFVARVWLAYGLARWGLSYTALIVADQVALASLAALVYGACSAVIAWEHRNDPPRVWPFRRKPLPEERDP
jgi:hypothetical protein